MARYIDADKFAENKLYLRARLEFPDGTKTGGYWAVLSSVVIKDAETEDVAPVVHAHWIEDGDTDICSNCNERVFPCISGLQMDKRLKEGKTYWNYCPHCGAKMDGVENDR